MARLSKSKLLRAYLSEDVSNAAKSNAELSEMFGCSASLVSQARTQLRKPSFLSASKRRVTVECSSANIRWLMALTLESAARMPDIVNGIITDARLDDEESKDGD